MREICNVLYFPRKGELLIQAKIRSDVAVTQGTLAVSRS